VAEIRAQTVSSIKKAVGCDSLFLDFKPHRVVIQDDFSDVTCRKTCLFFLFISKSPATFVFSSFK
jgi:hypothetical protein